MIAEFKRLMITPYIAVHCNTIQNRNELKKFIVTDLTSKMQLGNKYYKMAIDWVNSGDMNYIIRTCMQECVYDDKIRGRDGDIRFTKWVNLRVMCVIHHQ